MKRQEFKLKTNPAGKDLIIKLIVNLIDRNN